MNTIICSAEESDFFKLKIGRGKFDRLSPALLEKQIVAGSFDVCRLKADAGELRFAEKLESLNFPYYHAGEVINYTITLDEIKKMNLDGDSSGTSFERYDGSQEKIVKDIILKNCMDDPIGYFKTPYLNSLLTARKETAFLAAYFSGTYVTGNKMIFLMKKKGDYAGLIAYSVENNTLESLLVTLKPEHRHYANLSLFIRETFRFTKERGIGRIVCGARLNNRMMQHIFEKYGRKNGADIIYHILPLLTLENESTVQAAVKKKFSSDRELLEAMRRKTSEIAGSFAPGVPSFTRMKRIGNIPAKNITRLSITLISSRNKNPLFITKSFDAKNTPSWITYHGIQPH